MRIRTGYSFRTAYGHIEDVMNVLKANGEKVAPISDRMSTFGFNRWTKLAKKAGLRPVYGVELAVVASLGEKKPAISYWTFWATTSLIELHEAIGLATDNPGKEPSLTYDQAMSFKGLIKIAGERTMLKNLEKWKKDRTLYLSLSPSSPIGWVRAGEKAGFRFLAQCDNSFPRPEDKEIYRVALGFRADVQTYPQYIIGSGVALYNHLTIQFNHKLVSDAIGNKNRVLEKCKATLQKAKLLAPVKKQTLRAMCLAGAKKLRINLNDKVYKERLNKELALIDSKKFEDYFYIIADMIAWAKERMIVGPARGSSCGSLVCYLLGITSIDPIPFNLIFERFIDVNRTDLPDIDIDFSDTQRHLVFEYAEEKYGQDHVARLGTIGLFQPRSAMKQAAGALKIPPWKVDKVLDNIIERSGGDARALQTLEDTLKDTDAGRSLLAEFPEINIAAGMEGHPNNASQHAAGIVITAAPVHHYVAVDRRSRSIMCDKKDAEDYNLLKIDALGLTQLSIFERTLELIGEKPISGWLERLPLDDKKAFEVINKGHFAGIFQFAGGALQSLVKQIKVNDVEDIIAITALARPGPLVSGGAQSWVRRRAGKEKITLPHPLFKPYLEETLGIVMYQEQVMTIGRGIGDLSWEDVTDLRKAMSRSLGKEYFDKYGDRWKAAAKKKGIEPHILNKVWDDLCAYGAWAFNRSHAVAYGVVSYWCCWLKAHHPIEFAAATLDAEAEPLKQIQLLRELASEGVDYIPVDAEHSTNHWSVAVKNKKKMLIGPLTVIKGFGPATVSEIMLARKEGTELRAPVKKRLAAAKTDIDSLFPIRDRIKTIVPDMAKLNIFSDPYDILKVQCGVEGQVMIIAVARRISPKDENDPQSVAKRGYAVKGPTKAVNLFFIDDTDEIFCKINRYDYERLGAAVIERGRPGKSIYAVKGTVPKDFRMISVKAIRYIGDMEEVETVKGEQE